MAEQKEKTIGGFKVLQEIQAGSGSQGTVYKAVCEDAKHGLVAVGTVVALKVMPIQDEGGAQWRKLQKRTAELARLDHPNVVKYYGCFSEQGLFNDVHVVVQEFLQGATLKDRLVRSRNGLDVDEALRIVDSALAGLEYTASCGLVHRDVKPGNIFICDDGGVKLIDFEIAKQEGGTATASVGNIRGSFDYMSPDFTNPDFHGDVRSDVFSMGVVLHEALTGRTPYERLEGDDKQANFAFLSRWAQTASGGHSPIHVSSRVKRLLAHADGVIERALVPNREERYRDFTEFREGLKAIRFRSLKSGGAAYQLLQFIGKGGFGEVFKARNRETGRLVAVKHLMKSEYAERFRREAKIMKKLQDPCFVQFVDFFEMDVGGDRNAFLVMAFLDGMPGSSLRDAIKRRADAPMEWRDVFVAFARYARGLLAMHKQGIFHRDIKPSNLYYPSGRPGASAIMDLGIARDVTGTATTGQVPGTLDYMPPEVAISDNRGDGGMDIYALGLCLYEALTGKMAFPRLPTGSTAYSTFFARAKSRQAPAFEAPEVRGDAEVLSLLEDMTNPDASRRIKNAGLLLMRIEAIIKTRFGGEASVDDIDQPTVGTIAMTRADARTVATEVMGALAAAELEKSRRNAVGGKKSRVLFVSLAAALLLALAGAGAFFAMRGRQALVVPASQEGSKDALKRQQDELDRQRREFEAQQRKFADERKAEEVRRKAEEEAWLKRAEEERIKAEKEAERLAADKTKTEAEKAAEAERLAEDQKRRDAESARLLAEEEARRKKEEAARREEERKLQERESALKKQQEEMERQRKEFEAREKALEEKRRKDDADRIKAEEEKAEAARKLAEEAKKKAAEEERLRAVEEEANRKKAEEERKRMEAELAEIKRQLEEAQERERKEKAAREAEAARIAAKIKAAEEDQRKAREAAVAAEKAKKALDEANARRESTAKDFVEKAGMYYESEEYTAAVKAYRDAVKSGHAMSKEELSEFDDACKRADARLRQIRARCEDQIRLGQTPLRDIKDLDEESRNLVDWRFDVMGH